jgi:hypothetical protein
MEKRKQYWIWFLKQKKYHGHGFTEIRLEKAWVLIKNDSEFWSDILIRHGGNHMSPQEMEQADRFNYEHCMGNMTGMIMQAMIENGIIKP